MQQEVATLESDTLEAILATFAEGELTFNSAVPADVDPEMEAYWADK
jgi:hypothetical protein